MLSSTDTGVSVSHAAIITHFKKLGVPRSLVAKVRAKSDAMVMESMVTGKVSSVTIKRHLDAKIKSRPEDTFAIVPTDICSDGAIGPCLSFIGWSSLFSLGKTEGSAYLVTTRLPLDWDRIQELYRANKLSVREIGSMFGVSHVSILKRANAFEWVRDLDAKNNARAEKIVARRTVTNGVTSESTTKQVVTEERIQPSLTELPPTSKSKESPG